MYKKLNKIGKNIFLKLGKKKITIPTQVVKRGGDFFSVDMAREVFMEEEQLNRNIYYTIFLFNITFHVFINI